MASAASSVQKCLSLEASGFSVSRFSSSSPAHFSQRRCAQAKLTRKRACATETTSVSRATARAQDRIRAHATAGQAAPEVPPVDIDNSTVLVVGGGGVGMELVRLMAKAGSWITAFQRGDKFKSEIEGLGAMLALGDVMAVDSIAKALRTNTFDAVVSTVGGGLTDIKVDSQGNINLIEAAEKAGIPRFVLISSVGAGDSASAVPEKEMDVLRPVLLEKEKAEERLKSSTLKWTIIRPGGLVSEPATGKAFLTEDRSAVGIISRGDVAALTAQALFNSNAEGKVLAAIDPTKNFSGVREKSFTPFKL